MNTGYLIVSVYAENASEPIKDAKVKVKNLENVYITNDLGMTSTINLETTSKNNSLEPNIENPYKTYDIEVSKTGMTTVTINGIEIFDSITSYQNIFLSSEDLTGLESTSQTIADITLNGNYSTKYQEVEKTSTPYVLKEVIIPEYIKVHDGVPDDTKAASFYLTFSDYIKNVACSEIYSSWPVEAIKANVLAIISFTLNRIYTEWYKSKGYDFTITSITAYDQKYTHNRTIFDSISKVVDEMLLKYIKRSNREEPLLAQYCDGDKLKNEGWLWQWGSKDLADQGYNYIDILKYYYGNDILIEDTKYEQGLPTSFPGYNLEEGMCGPEIKQFQDQINIIRGNYSGLLKINNPNGEFDEETKNSVEIFQSAFGLNKTGIVDFTTWYKISYLYIAVKRMIFGVYDR